jgi:hypothetical protein
MIAPISPACRLACQAILVAALGVAVAGCAGKPASEMPVAAQPAAPAAATAPAAAAAAKSDVTPMDRAEANAQCWMKYDKTAVSLEAKAKLVDKCAAEKMQGK